MRLKYAPLVGKPMGTPGSGKKRNPAKWKTGPDTVTRDKYYAFLRHRAQARFRNEPHELVWETWLNLWPNELWGNRGRGLNNHCITRLDPELPWRADNVRVCVRAERGSPRVAT